MARLSSKSIIDSVLIFTRTQRRGLRLRGGQCGKIHRRTPRLEVRPEQGRTSSLPVSSRGHFLSVAPGLGRPTGRQAGRKEGGVAWPQCSCCWCCRVGMDGVALPSLTSSAAMSLGVGWTAGQLLSHTHARTRSLSPWQRCPGPPRRRPSRP